MFADAQQLLGATVQTGGSKYKVGDVLTVTGGLALFSTNGCWQWTCTTPNTVSVPTTAAVLQVLTVDGNGAVQTFVPLSYGAYYTIPATPNTVSGGSGSGCVLNLTFQLYWENAPWYVPVQTDIYQVMAEENVRRFDANLIPNAPPSGTPIDYSQPTRSGSLLNNYVSVIRQAIQTGGKVPLSVTAGAIPPEALPHALNLAAWQLASSTPSLPYAVITEKGMVSPLGDLAASARQWIEKVRKGLNVTYPSDPDPSFNAPVRYGSIGTPADLESYSAPYTVGFPTSQIGFP